MTKYDPGMYCEHANETARGLCTCGPTCACREKMCPLVEANRRAHVQVRDLLNSPPAMVVKEPVLIRNTSTPEAAAFWARAEQDQACDRLLENVERAFDEAKAKIRDQFLALTRSLPELPTTVMATSLPPKKTRKANSALGRRVSASATARKKSRS